MMLSFHKLVYLHPLLQCLQTINAQQGCANGQYQKFAGRTTCYTCPSPYQACSYTNEETFADSHGTFTPSGSVLFQLWGGGGGTTTFANASDPPGIYGNGGAGGYSSCYMTDIPLGTVYYVRTGSGGAGGSAYGGDGGFASYVKLQTADLDLYSRTVNSDVVAGGGGGAGAAFDRFSYTDQPSTACFLNTGTLNGGNGGGTPTNCKPKTADNGVMIGCSGAVSSDLSGRISTQHGLCYYPTQKLSSNNRLRGGAGCESGDSSGQNIFGAVGCAAGGWGYFDIAKCKGGGFSLSSPQDTRTPPRHQDRVLSPLNPNTFHAGTGGQGPFGAGYNGMVIMQSPCSRSNAFTVYDSINHALVCICNRGSVKAFNSTCIICKEDTYSKDGSLLCIQCPSNTTSPNGSTDISSCTANAGYYFSLGSTTATICDSGHYCPAGATQPTQCSQDYYCPLGSPSPISCPPNTESSKMSSAVLACVPKIGYFGAPGLASVPCTNKPASFSYYTGNHTSSNTCPWTCNVGYFTNASNCQACTNKPTLYSTYTGNHLNSNACPWVCISVSNSVQNPVNCIFHCNTGFYMSSTSCQQCTNKPGSYSFYTGNYSILNSCPWACFPAPSNSIQDLRTCLFTCNTGHFTQNGLCSNCTNKPASFSYYTGSHSTQDMCPWSCMYENNSIQNPISCLYVCKTGFYKSDNQCISCTNMPSDNAYYTGSHEYFNMCPWGCNIGYYRTTNSLCSQCTNKPYLDSVYTGNHSSSDSCPWKCNIGFYQNGIICQACTNKPSLNSIYTTNHASLNLCSWSCNIGFYTSSNLCAGCTNKPSLNSQYTGNHLSSNACQWTCNTGFYTSGSICAACTIKPALNSYFTGNHASSNACPWSCSTIANGFATPATCSFQCNFGYYMNTITCTKCSPGKFSSAIGATSIDTCKSCDIGTYETSTNSSSAGACIDCEMGKFNPYTGATACISCPPFTNTKTKRSFSCDVVCGTFFNASSNSIEPCPEDFICD